MTMIAMTFNPEITVGNIITAVAIGMSAVGGFYAMKYAVALVGDKLNFAVENLTTKLSSELTVLRNVIQNQGERVDRMERRHEERMTIGEERMRKLEDNQNQLTRMFERQSGQNEELSRWIGPERRRTPREKS